MYAIARRKAFDTASARQAASRRRRVPPPYCKGGGEDRHHSARSEDASKRARWSVVICHDQRGPPLAARLVGNQSELGDGFEQERGQRRVKRRPTPPPIAAPSRRRLHT